jgi:hypothetical protein
VLVFLDGSNHMIRNAEQIESPRRLRDLCQAVQSELAIRRIDHFKEAIGEEEQAVSPLESNGVLADLVQLWQVQSEQGILATEMLKLAMTGPNQHLLESSPVRTPCFGHSRQE